MKQKDQVLSISPAHEWLLSLTIDEVTEVFKRYEIEILNMDEKDALEFIYKTQNSIK